MSRKSIAVGTGAMAFNPFVVDIFLVSYTLLRLDGGRCLCADEHNFFFAPADDGVNGECYFMF